MNARSYRWPLLTFAGFLFIEMGTAVALFVSKLGLSPESVNAYYRGAGLTPAKSFAGLMAVLVPHLVGIALTLFVLTHLVGWAGMLRRQVFRWLVGTSFGLAAAGMLLGLVIRWVTPAAAPLKVVAVMGQVATLAVWALLVIRLAVSSGRGVAGDQALVRTARLAGLATPGNAAQGSGVGLTAVPDRSK